MEKKEVPLWEAILSYLLAALAVIAILIALTSRAGAKIDTDNYKDYIRAYCRLDYNYVGGGYDLYTYNVVFACSDNSYTIRNVSVQYELHSDYADLDGVRSADISSITRDNPYNITGSDWFSIPFDPDSLFDAINIHVEILSVSGVAIKAI